MRSSSKANAETQKVYEHLVFIISQWASNRKSKKQVQQLHLCRWRGKTTTAVLWFAYISYCIVLCVSFVLHLLFVVLYCTACWPFKPTDGPVLPTTTSQKPAQLCFHQNSMIFSVVWLNFYLFGVVWFFISCIFRCDSISLHLPLSVGESVSESVGDSFRLEIAIASPSFASLFFVSLNFNGEFNSASIIIALWLQIMFRLFVKWWCWADLMIMDEDCKCWSDDYGRWSGSQWKGRRVFPPTC